MKRSKWQWGKSGRNVRKEIQKFTSLENLENRTLLTASGFATEVAPVEPAAEVSTMENHERIQRIVNGTQTSDYESVGIVNGQCSGTLIAPNAVLTAAHCIPESGPQDFEVGGRTYSAKQVVVHPQYESEDIDLAVMILNENVVGIEPAEINRVPPQVGQMLTLVGFGATGTAQSGHDGSFGVKHVGQTPIDEVTSTLVNWNYDDPSESNTAPGDSGGAAFLEIDGKLVLAGVTSGGTLENAGLGDKSIDMRVDAFASWVDNVMAGNVGAPGDVPTDDGNTSDDDPVDDIDDGFGDIDDGFPGDDLGDDFGDDSGDDLGDFDDEPIGGDISQEEAVELALEELFHYDTNGDDQLSRRELVNEFMDFGYTRGEARDEANFLLEEFDMDGNRKLDLNELVYSYGGEPDGWQDDGGDVFDDPVDDGAGDGLGDDVGDEFVDGDFGDDVVVDGDSGFGLLPGDFNDDGFVGFDDFLTMSNYFGYEDMGYSQGDIDGNEVVDFGDFLKFSDNFGSEVNRNAMSSDKVDDFFATC